MFVRNSKLLNGLLVVPIAAVAAFNVSMNTQESELSLLALANVEALAQAENDTFTAGYTSGTKYKFSGITIGVGFPWQCTVGCTWTTHTCCVSSSAMNGCNFKLQDPECSRL